MSIWTLTLGDPRLFSGDISLGRGHAENNAVRTIMHTESISNVFHYRASVNRGESSVRLETLMVPSERVRRSNGD